MTTITYTIEVPREEIEQLQSMLQQRNIPFDPRGQVTACNDAFRADTTAYGNEAGDIIESINTYLANASIKSRVRSDYHDWSIPQLQQFLQFAVDNFNWAGGSVDYAWWEGSDDDWQRIVEQNQWVIASQP